MTGSIFKGCKATQIGLTLHIGAGHRVPMKSEHRTKHQGHYLALCIKPQDTLRQTDCWCSWRKRRSSLVLRAMCAYKAKQLPLFLVQARARVGLSQQVLAERTGVLQTTLCALERGRRVNPGAALREALGRGLELSEADQAAMAVAIEHDRIVSEVERGLLKNAGPLVSAVLLAADQMTEVERAGLLRRIQRAMRATEQHSALVHEPPVDAQGEEAGMS